MAHDWLKSAPPNFSQPVRVLYSAILPIIDSGTGEEEPLKKSDSMTASQTQNQSQTQAGNIRVCARFRPQNALEKKQQAVECVQVEPDGVTIHMDNESKMVANQEKYTFTFDHVFGTTSTQAEVYESTAKPLVASALSGYNCTCFVYGQTGTGKTFAMEGVPGDQEYEGIIPRVMQEIFDGIQHMQQELEFLVRVAYIEIYLEKIRDLLKPSSNNLSVRESKEKGVWVAGATEISCASAQEMLEVMHLGGTNRAISSTRMNNDSSRSHSVFIITIEQRNVTTGSSKSGKLFLVDLAGSEKVGKTLAKGQTLKEAQHINKSLSALGSVMNALTKQQSATGGAAPQQHVPYRDSKLTRLLQDSLGGNSETTLLVCASCSSYNFDETLSTLRFGSRAKSIKNKPKVNEEPTVQEYKLLVADKDRQILDLMKQLDALKDHKHSLDEAQRFNKQVEQLHEELEQMEDELSSKTVEIESLETRCEELTQQNNHYKHHYEAYEAKSLVFDALKSQNAHLQEEVQLMKREIEQLHVQLVSGSGSTSAPMHELLQSKLAMKETRLDQVLEELTNCRNFYEQQVQMLESTIEEKDRQLRTILEFAETHDEISHHMDMMLQKSRLLHSVRGGGGGGGALDDNNQAEGGDTATPSRSNGSARSCKYTTNKPPPPTDLRAGFKMIADQWELDQEVHPMVPIDLDSPVVKRVIASIPEKGREKINKWLEFVFEGRDIRSSHFSPEFSMEGLNEQVSADMRRLIVPLVKKRCDLQVQTYNRVRYVKLCDLKICLRPKYHEEMVESSNDSDYSSDEEVTGRSGLLSRSVIGRDHVFYGPKSDPASASVLHGKRHLHSCKDYFVSEPVDMSSTMLETRTFLDPSSVVDGHLSATTASRGGGGGYLGGFSVGKAMGVGKLFKNRVSSRYHKYHVHEGTTCFGCRMSPIVGCRWKCHGCEDVQLCETCYSLGIHGFERDMLMGKRIEQVAVEKCRVLGSFPELFDLIRSQICQDDMIAFRRVVEWICDIVSGQRLSVIGHKSIVKKGLLPEVRARIVGHLGELASIRSTVILRTEWFTEETSRRVLPKTTIAAAAINSEASNQAELELAEPFTPTLVEPRTRACESPSSPQRPCTPELESPSVEEEPTIESPANQSGGTGTPIEPTTPPLSEPPSEPTTPPAEPDDDQTTHSSASSSCASRARTASLVLETLRIFVTDTTGSTMYDENVFTDLLKDWPLRDRPGVSLLGPRASSMAEPRKNASSSIIGAGIKSIKSIEL